MLDVARAAEQVARESYGRLLSLLAVRTRDISQAEDVLADAFAQALAKWPVIGVPENPDAWLLTVARNRFTDQQRRQIRFPTDSKIPELLSQDAVVEPYADERLGLMMVCTHPAIASDLHAPLMLQTVLGLEAKSIARLFLVSPTALSKRLVRAKSKIRDAGISFQIPEKEALPERCAGVLEAVYGLHSHDWLDPKDSMGDEALFLADLLARLMPDNAESFGLSALIAFGHCRRNARVSQNILIPTDEQDVSLWNDDLIEYGQRQLSSAYRLKDIGRFQIEAAIESVHIARKDSGYIDWAALTKLYHALLKYAPSAGGFVAQAVVASRLHGAEVGLKMLESVETSTGTAFQPLWAARADMHAGLGQNSQADTCYEKAISLATDGPMINLLKKRQRRLP